MEAVGNHKDPTRWTRWTRESGERGGNNHVNRDSQIHRIEPDPLSEENGKPATGPNGQVDRATANAAYLNGMCRDGCGRPHSAGRTRCDECHRIWQTTVDGYDR